MADAQSLGTWLDLLSHDVWADILAALADRISERPHGETLRFAELRKRIGHDDPGNFNYHLKRLVGTFVEKTDEGYRLSDIGQRLVAVCRSGRFDPGRSQAR
ncbi:hypothetical protein EKH57_15640 [Halorubrum sp. BOL3-1]|uniref:DUF7347 domain-containing protein n=1 Tax=Halorubrum sp. BOL3-1 TaxID=2497325 RepID=UPI001004EA92|nr:hypothetical protein [Halorubrum sp. BOL3-1]QAU14020.1 hypothetical protein EKH57_15640 [Halorubrum sp. BOL3-1]